MKVKVWDLPTRVFHWLLALCVGGAFLSSLNESALTLHIYFGEFVLGLVVFRLGYGFVGNYYARYESFLRAPSVAANYCSRLFRLKPPKILEHNPLASYVFGLMVVFSGLAALTGLLVLGGQERIGLLAGVLSHAQGYLADQWHQYLAYSLLGLIALHLAGAATDSYLHRENLVKAIFVDGKKHPPEDYLALPEEDLKPRCQAKAYTLAVTFATLAFVVFWPTDFRTAETKKGLDHDKDKEMQFYTFECGACHFAFPPNLLPQRSWEEMVANLEDHFGDDASLDEEGTVRLRNYLLAGAAERSDSEAAYYLTRKIGPTQKPQRITELPYWDFRHQEISEETFKTAPIRNRINCIACHRLALFGSFEDAHIEVPELQRADNASGKEANLGSLWAQYHPPTL
ncbi:MAG: cytochrome b/b6 domain-containing protein [bacterium]|nr:cytochrome b/b6 domain-containing protein [bacterium]